MTRTATITAVGIVLGIGIGIYGRLVSPGAWTLALITGIVLAVLIAGVLRLLFGRTPPDRTD